TANYITSADLPPIQSPLTFENGLREDGGVVKMGLDVSTLGTTNEGLLTEPTVLALGDVLSSNYVAAVLQEVAGNRFFTLSGVLDSDVNGTIGIGVNNVDNQVSIELIKRYSGASQSLTFGYDDYISITDTKNSKGLQYISDYSVNGTLDPRWIPDWGAVTNYVDANVPPTLTFENGLHEDGGIVKLGLD